MVKIACIGAGYVGGVGVQSRQPDGLLGSRSLLWHAPAGSASNQRSPCYTMMHSTWPPAIRRHEQRPMPVLCLSPVLQPTMAMIALKCPEIEVVVLDINEGKPNSLLSSASH